MGIRSSRFDFDQSQFDSIRVYVVWTRIGSTVRKAATFRFNLHTTVEYNCSIFESDVLREIERDYKAGRIHENNITVEIVFQKNYVPTPGVIEQFVDNIREIPFEGASNIGLMQLEISRWIQTDMVSEQQRTAVYKQVGRLLAHVAQRPMTEQQRDDAMRSAGQTDEAGFIMGGPDADRAHELMNRAGVDI
jgi:hypothetical protein